MPPTDELPFMLKYGDPWLICCGCESAPFVRQGQHSRSCRREQAEQIREHELAHALKPEDIRWLNEHGWDGQF